MSPTTRISDITMGDLLLISILVILLGLICVTVMKSRAKAKEKENEKLPVEEDEATLIDIQYAAGTLPTIIMFETNSGKRVRLSAGIELAVNLIVGDKGYLKWQGNKLLTFLIGKNVEEATREAAAAAAAQLERQNKLRADMNMWTCGVCGAANLQHWTRCADCGAKKVEGDKKLSNNTEANKFCPQCGSVQQQGDTFCAYCGQKLK